MLYREDKRDGKSLSALGFGCMRLPGRMGAIDKEKTELLILQAIEAGVNYFDTAYLYPGSEATLGEIMERDGLRDMIYIATKLPHSKVRKREDLDRLFNTSLDRLRTDHVDYYLIHNVSTVEQWQRIAELGAVEWIEQKKKEGAIGQIGFSFHGAAPEFDKMLDAYDWDFVQIQYNYVNEHYQAGRDGLQKAAERGLSVIVMEPLLGGRLADKLPAEASRVLEKADPRLGNVGWALKWLWDQPEVTVVLSGMNSEQQLQDNCRVASEVEPGSMTPEDYAVIEQAHAIFSEAFRIPCTGCNYCLPCPSGISIPAMFAAYNESFSVNRVTGIMQYITGSGAPDPENVHFATDCVECGACMKKCPQHIAIPDELKKVARRLQPPGTRAALRVYSRITG